MIKAYPLIYSRTKNADFLSDFLTRPSDLDYTKALKYVHYAMKNIDIVNNIRYTTFSVDKYCVCGGIACVSRNLLKSLMQQKVMTDIGGAKEYIIDNKGRGISCFIGFAIDKSNVTEGNIPNLDLEDYWRIYLEHIKRQWNEQKTETELVDDFIEIADKKCTDNMIVPEIEYKGKKLYLSEDYTQDTLEYFFHKVLHENSDISFISDITNLVEVENTLFNNISVSRNVLEEIRMKNNLRKQEDLKKQKEVKKNQSGEKTQSKIKEQKNRQKIIIAAMIIALLLMIIILKKFFN